tara:strand:- start:1872 stop:3674 length:1803 start_codon:yes stop_codon:yes gene_type:complete
MAAYKDLVGQKITKVTSNPGEPKTGQMWYNSTSGSLKGLSVVKAFTSSSTYLAELFGQGGAGSQTSALSFGGAGSPGSTVVTTTGEYNGSGWATGGAMSTARRSMIGFGIQTAALGSTGYSATGNQTASEEYDGSSWTGGGAYPVGQELGSGCGTQTAGLGCGGQPTPATSNEYDGSSWTASPGNLNDGRSFLTTVGTQTAALAAGARSSNPLNKNCEEYNGSTWTSVNSLNTTRDLVSFGAGIQTAAISYGTPGSLESYDGTNWTNEPATMGTARNSGSNAGSATAALACGGSPGGATALTEEYNVSTNTITAAAWASGGSLNQGRINVSMGGTQTAGIVLGGHQSPGAEPAAVETYNGSAFTSGTAIGPYTGDYAAYAGSQTQGIIFGGAPYTTNTAEYDGEWAAGGSLSQGRSDLMGAGTGETSAVAMGGFSPAPTARAETEEYGGTSWTSGGSLSTGRGQGAGFGIETAALVTGGEVSGGTKQSATEEYNGSSWTSGGSLITATGDYIGGWGTQTNGVVVGGATTGYVTTTLEYDGTSFTTRPNAANPAGRTQTAGANAAAGLRAGGGPNTTQRDGSEEFTGETTAVNIENFNTSV